MENIAKRISTSTDKNGKVSYRKSIETGNTTQSINVEEVENGFVVRVSEDGYKGTGDKREWFNDTKTYISTTNPLEDDDEKEASKSFKEEIKEALSNLKC